MIFQSSFDTVACAANATNKIINDVMEAIVSGKLGVLNVKVGDNPSGMQIMTIRGGDSFSDQIHYFNHPLLFTHKLGGESQKFTVIDLRNYGRYSHSDGKFLVRASSEYALCIRRAILNKIWEEQRPEVLRDVSDLPIMTFCALISEVLTHRFSASPYETSVLSTLSAYYYYSLFTNDDDFEQHSKDLLIGKISRITQVPSSTVTELLKDTKCIHGVENFVETIKKKINNPAFELLNVAILFTVVKGSWYGSGASEIIGVSLEHPPTWIALVESSVSSQTFKKTSLARISQRFTRNNIATAFLRSVDSLCGGPDAVINDGRIDVDYATQCRL